jgi:hypothetical protein
MGETPRTNEIREIDHQQGTLPGVFDLPHHEPHTGTLPAPMTYTLWAGPLVAGPLITERWIQQREYGDRPIEFADEWEAYAMAAYYSRTDNLIYLLRDVTGQHTYAVFSNGQRVWHTLEANHD